MKAWPISIEQNYVLVSYRQYRPIKHLRYHRSSKKGTVHVSMTNPLRLRRRLVYHAQPAEPYQACKLYGYILQNVSFIYPFKFSQTMFLNVVINWLCASSGQRPELISLFFKAMSINVCLNIFLTPSHISWIVTTSQIYGGQNIQTCFLLNSIRSNIKPS
jgi:hypothetical protein